MINSAKEAARYIERIMQERCVLIASSADYNVSIMTAIVDILDDENEVVFDYSGSEDLDKLIRKSGSLDFTTYIDDVNIAFSSGAAENTVYKGRPAFKINMPSAIQRVQRREFHRVSPPLSERPTCVMEYDGHIYKATVIDISIGGIGALIENAHFRAGDVIERCVITTPIGIEIEASLKVVSVRKKSEGSKEIRYGFTFKDATAFIESNLQKYVFYLERKEVAKRRELRDL